MPVGWFPTNINCATQRLTPWHIRFRWAAETACMKSYGRQIGKRFYYTTFEDGVDLLWFTDSIRHECVANKFPMKFFFVNFCFHIRIARNFSYSFPQITHILTPSWYTMELANLTLLMLSVWFFVSLSKKRGIFLRFNVRREKWKSYVLKRNLLEIVFRK